MCISFNLAIIRGKHWRMRKRFLYGSGMCYSDPDHTFIWQMSSRSRNTLRISAKPSCSGRFDASLYSHVHLGSSCSGRGSSCTSEAGRTARARALNEALLRALALSFMPVCFLVVLQYMVLNRQVENGFRGRRPGAAELIRESARPGNHCKKSSRFTPPHWRSGPNRSTASAASAA